MIEKTEIMDSAAIDRTIRRMAHEILEKNVSLDGLYLMGVQRRGVPLANRISDKIFEAEGVRLPVGVLDITFYRDDLSLRSEHPVLNGTDINFEIEGAEIILADDVLYTGRTVRAAIDALLDRGRPKSIQLAVFVDRGHRELPFKADYVGKNVPTSKAEVIKVRFKEVDGADQVIIADAGREA